MLLKPLSALLFLLASTTTASHLAAGYQQCGGYNHNGPTNCERGYHCERLNDYFYQCLPGHGTRTSSSIPTGTRIPSAAVVHAHAPRITASQTQTRPTATPSIPSHLVEFARRDRERREREMERRGEGTPVGATPSPSMQMVMPVYPQPTQTLTAEDIDQINLLDDIEREILRYSRNGGLSPAVVGI